ncbi:MAG: hypothetical protein KDN05_20495, partial [Verrucomicrobiae bacterium]|nr:hypothetical protein [Verrucomicrobiae bacterium]
MLRAFRLILVTAFAPMVSYGGGWTDILHEEAAPKLVAITSRANPPGALPFISSRMAEAGIWTSFLDPATVAKIGDTTSAVSAEPWSDTGFFLHIRKADGTWATCPLGEDAKAGVGKIKTSDGCFSLHPALWRNIQKTRPEKPAHAGSDAGSAVPELAGAGSFLVNLAERKGPACTPDDPKQNRFIDFDGDITKEQARVVVPPGYDGSKPFGLMVFISPTHGADGGNRLFAKYKPELAARDYIWISPITAGNNKAGDNRVWVAQHCRAWALHHYVIDPKRMIISGSSNGGDAASATMVSTPMGFCSVQLIAPPSQPPVGPVPVPRESDHTQ